MKDKEQRPIRFVEAEGKVDIRGGFRACWRGQGFPVALDLRTM